jgi:PAS domain S-box-containing protein
MSQIPLSSLSTLCPSDLHELVFNNTGDYAIIVSDLQGMIVAWNPGAEEVLGWTAAQAVGKHVDLFFTPEDRKAGRSTAEMHIAATQGRAIDERWHVKRDGRYFWTLGQLMPLRRNGALLGYSKILRDRTQERLVSERLRLTQAVGGIGSFEIFPEEALISVSPEFCRMWGIEERQLYPLSYLLDLVHPEDRPLLRTGEGKLPANALQYLEYRILRPGTDEERWIARQGEPIAVDSLQATRYLGLCHDITERKRAELLLAESEARFRAITHSIEQMVWTTSANGQPEFFNERWHEFTGSRPGATAPEGWLGYVHAHDRPVVYSAWRHSLQTGTPYRGEFRLSRHSGGYDWVLCRAHGVRANNGHITSWLLSATVISEIVEARQVLAQAQHDLQQQLAEKTMQRDRVWRLSHDFMAVLAANGTLLTLNQACENAFDWGSGTGSGRAIAEQVHPNDQARMTDALATLAGGQRTVIFEVRMRARDAGYRLVSWTAVAYEREVYAIGRDVTDQRETEERLRQTQKMDAIGQLTGGIAHDFNNLLTAILGSLELMKRGLDAGRLDSLERYLEGATSSAHRAAALTQRLLSFARRRPLQLEPVEVNALVVSLEDLIHCTLGEAYTLTTQLDACLPTLLGDSNQLENALLNLVINARDAMPDGGEIKISTACTHTSEIGQHGQGLEPGEYVAICVSDTGPGMPDDVKARAFEPFFTTKAAGKGTGLGLAMIYGYVNQAKGHVEIVSSGAEGTRICMYLPRALDMPRPT